MTRLLSIILSLFLTFSPNSHAKSGEVLGYSLFSGVGAYINNHPIRSYNIDGKTAVKARDLASYGFSVEWDEKKRCTSITRNSIAQIIPQTDVYKNKNRAGRQDKTILSTDITTKINGKAVECVNIDGYTVIYFDDLAVFGSLFWDSENYSIKLTIAGVPQAEFVPIPENPNVTTVYSYGKKSLLIDNEVLQAYLDSGWFLTPPAEKLIALTFDDGPSQHTSRILDVLEKHNSRATFFVVGNRISKYSDILLRTHELKMEIGNHSFSHANLSKLSHDGIISEKVRTENAIMGITKKGSSLFRPPYGSRNDAVLSAYNMPAILWSIDTLDWKTRNAKSTVDAVLNNVKDGDIILMHDIYSPTADAVEALVPKLIERGYSLVTVSELANARAGKLEIKSYSQFR